MEYGRSEIEIEKSGDCQSYTFGIKNPEIIFDMVCNKMYGNPLRTSIQEYMCNARDSHRESGQDKLPIQVVIPTDLDPTLYIKDFGVGISEDRMETVFVYLGESTKRANNNQTGGFGIGAKVGFSYTDNFTIVTTYNGSKRTYLAYLGNRGIGQLDLIHDEHTDEQNGTTIAIPIKEGDRYKIDDMVRRAGMFWDVKPEVINCRDRKLFDVEIVRQGSNWSYIKSNAYSIYSKTVAVTIDGVLYDDLSPVQTEVVDEFASTEKHTLILHFKTGELDMAINRESIQFTDETKNLLVKRANRIKQIAQRKVNHKLEGAKTFDEFVISANNILSTLSFMSNRIFTWKGVSFRAKDGKLRLRTPKEVEIRQYYIDDECDQVRRDVKESVVLEPGKPIFFNDNMVKILRSQKIRYIMARRDLTTLTIIHPLQGAKDTLINGPNDLPELFDGFRKLGFLEFSKVKMTKVNKGRSKINLRIQHLNNSECEYVDRDDLRDDGPNEYVYCMRNHHYPSGLRRCMRTLGDKRKLILANQMNIKFIKSCGIRPAQEGFRRRWTELQNQMTEADFLGLTSSYVSVPRQIDDMLTHIADLKDPLFAKLHEMIEYNKRIRTYSGDNKLQSKYKELRQYSGRLNRRSSRGHDTNVRRYKKFELQSKQLINDIEERIALLKRRYPLLNEIGSHALKFKIAVRDDLICYMNTKWETHNARL